MQPIITNKAEINFNFGKEGSAIVQAEVSKGSERTKLVLTTYDKKGKESSTSVTMDAKEVKAIIYALQGITLFMGDQPIQELLNESD